MGGLQQPYSRPNRAEAVQEACGHVRSTSGPEGAPPRRFACVLLCLQAHHVVLPLLDLFVVAATCSFSSGHAALDVYDLHSTL